MSDWLRLALSLTLHGLLHPRDGIDCLRVAWRFRRRAWWRRPPFLPIPARDYVRWRLYTAYGDASHLPRADEIIRYARWACRAP